MHVILRQRATFSSAMTPLHHIAVAGCYLSPIASCLQVGEITAITAAISKGQKLCSAHPFVQLVNVTFSLGFIFGFQTFFSFRRNLGLISPSSLIKPSIKTSVLQKALRHVLIQAGGAFFSETQPFPAHPIFPTALPFIWHNLDSVCSSLFLKHFRSHAPIPITSVKSFTSLRPAANSFNVVSLILSCLILLP